ncbi:hypothetical protein Ciccas_002173 [Cichlidogyrus casuarinus]|uniref:H/ACA ribonucleoprotein complex non-core subunit NAF1 n=1 Tax=Cichlidogyrus casuarinus TaxID=1844966 RepID=A0ABD2QL56_9PLAT
MDLQTELTVINENTDLFYMASHAFGLNTDSGTFLQPSENLINFADYRDPNKIDLSEFISSESSDDDVDNDKAEDKIKTVKIVEDKKWIAPSAFPVDIMPGYCPPVIKPLSQTSKIAPFGRVRGIICRCAIVTPHPDKDPLNIGTALFFENRKALGEVYELFGTVKLPEYLVVLPDCPAIQIGPAPRPYKRPDGYTREKEIEEFKKKVSDLEIPDVKVGDIVYYAPDEHLLTLPVLLGKLNIPNEEIVSSGEEPAFSDDDKEREYQRAKKTKPTRKRLNDRKPMINSQNNPWNRSLKSDTNSCYGSYFSQPTFTAPRNTQAVSYLSHPAFGCQPSIQQPPPVWMQQIPTYLSQPSPAPSTHSWYDEEPSSSQPQKANLSYDEQVESRAFEVAARAMRTINPNATLKEIEELIKTSMK